MTQIAFIGLGNMGSGMAANLVRGGAKVRGYDLAPAACAQAAAAGAIICDAAGAAVRDADVVITMLPAGDHVRSVYDQDVLSHAKRAALLIDCSTIDQGSARDIAKAARAAGFRAADAPVSGGVAAAQAGTLAFMVGCPAEDFADVEAALKPMARAVFHAGEFGAGQAAKICNNMLLGVSMIATCEAFALAEKLGLDPLRFFEIVSQSSGQCWSVTSYCPWPGPVSAAPSNRNYEGGFSVAMMLKDLKLAQQAAASSSAAAPLGAAAAALYALFSGMGREGKDFSAIVQWLRGARGEL